MNKTDILAFILKNIVDEAKLSNKDYAIFAGYGLRSIREVTDLDVAVSKNGFNKLKSLPYLKIGKAKINNKERLYLELPFIGNFAEIEFFELEKEGFPSDKYSLKNLQKNKYLIKDKFKNPYINLKCVIELYSDITISNNKILVGDKYEISLERLNKNISHLELLLTKQEKFHTLIKEKIIYLKKIKYLFNK